ncbi:MATE family efflux transporter [Candidatus Dependentiae bacterium]|nr:MATE family efflux transporter [Candidatus Dependentiae bacterium]
MNSHKINFDEKNTILKTSESAGTLFSYWTPEAISLILLTVLPLFLDSWFVASLQSNALYGALGAATRAIHFLMKFAESIPVASIALIGRHNGAQEPQNCGSRLSDALWTTGIIGLILCCLFFFGAEYVYRFLGVPETMIPLGLKYLKVQAVTIPFMFLFQAFLGFFKGIKNTQTPLYINIATIALFIVSDYLLIYGFWKVPALALTGSALASLIRYVAATAIAAAILLFSKEYSRYFDGTFFKKINPTEILRLLKLSLPVVIDKGMLALALVWLGKMIAFGGEATLAASEIIRNLERWGLIGSLAFAQITTFIVSNNIGEDNPEGARNNLYKILGICISMTALTMAGLNLYLSAFTTRLDPSHALDPFIKPTAYLLTLFLSIDAIQIIFASALRGAGDVKRVMIIRSFACLGFFLPATTIISMIPGLDADVRFVTIYSLYYTTTAIMAILFLLRVRGSSWLKQKI